MCPGILGKSRIDYNKFFVIDSDLGNLLGAEGMSRPQARTIRKVVEHLEELGLSVYGPNMDRDGCEYPSLMDYSVEDILCRRRHIDRDSLYRSEEP